MPRPLRKHSPIRPWMVTTVVLVALATAVSFSTTVVSVADAEAAASEGSFDPGSYAADRFSSEVAPQIEDDAIGLDELLGELASGVAEDTLGHAPGASSAYSFAVEFTGVAGTPSGSILPVTVEGIGSDVTVNVQIGPALNGTAIRDVTGTVSFNSFTNQLEFQQVATEFNNQVRETVLKGVDPATIAGKTAHIVGAFTRVNPALVSIVPVVFEVE